MLHRNITGRPALPSSRRMTGLAGFRARTRNSTKPLDGSGSLTLPVTLPIYCRASGSFRPLAVRSRASAASGGDGLRPAGLYVRPDRCPWAVAAAIPPQWPWSKAQRDRRFQPEFQAPDARADIETVNYAKESNGGRIVAASDASRWRSYVCPRPGCGGRVSLRAGSDRRAHFAHFPGEGTPACDEYHPGAWTGPSLSPVPPTAVEEEPATLGLVLHELDGVWALNLRLPEIPRDELGVAGLETLRAALVDVSTGQRRHVQVSALDLRPGVGAARVLVPPSIQEYRTEPVGTWPATIDRRRWGLRSRGLQATGTLFRLRQGEWTRLVADSAVHQGETLMLLAERRCPPPQEMPCTLHFRTSSGGMHWACWELQIPDELDSVGPWLSRLGHVLVPRPWELTLVTPAREFTEDGTPAFWLGDTAILRVEAPRRSSDTTAIDRVFDSNTLRITVTTPEDGRSYLAVVASRPGPMRVSVGGVVRSTVHLHFLGRPTRSRADFLAGTPRLRVRVGESYMGAWGESEFAVDVRPSTPHEVHVDLGHETARARVMVWRHRVRSNHSDLAARDVANVLKTAFADRDVSLIEIDADGLGAIRIVPRVPGPSRSDVRPRVDRLAWRDHLLGQLSPPNDTNVTIMASHPRNQRRRVLRSIDTAVLIRSRLTLRGKNGGGDAQR